MLEVAVFIDGLTEKVGAVISWLIFLLVMIIGLDVLMRYAFSVSNPSIFELEWHLFAVIFLLGSAYTLQKNKHVRVDVFYSRFGDKTKAIIDILGTVFFLLPFCLVLIYASINPAIEAFSINESSPDPGGLPFRFVVKGMVPISFVLLLLQGLSIILKKTAILIK